MDFRILGPLEVWDDGTEVSLGGPTPRALPPCSSSTPTRSFPSTG